MEKQKTQSQRSRRRSRAARIFKQKQAAAQGKGSSKSGADFSECEGDEPPVREKRPPTRKKKNREPLFQEDIIDGFAFLCFKTYQDLEKTVCKLSGNPNVTGGSVTTEGGNVNTEATPLIDDPLPQLEKQKSTTPKSGKKNNSNNNCHKAKKKAHKASKQTCSSENPRPGEEILDHHRSASRDQLSDASSHGSFEQGYVCDSESGNDRGSEPECDLFTSKSDSNYIAKKNNPGHSHNCRSPPVLPPIHPVQNGTHHPEPSTAIAAVTASASPANTVSAMVVGSASPREPHIGSPAVLPIACPSPPAGMVPVSPPPFLQKGPSPATVPPNKEDTSSNKLMSNGYEFVNKFLHKRSPPVSAAAARATVTVESKPAINVYDFVSDHSAPSSPDAVVFLSQSKFHHKGMPPVVQQPPMTKDIPMDTKVGVSNGHSMPNICSSSPVPSLSAPTTQPSHKSALDMSMKSNLPVKQEPSAPVVTNEHRLHHSQLISQQQPLQQPQQQQQSSRSSTSSSYSIPFSTSQSVRKMTLSPRMSLSSPVLPSSSSAAPPVNTRTFVTTTSTTLSSSSHGASRHSCSPAVTMTTHSNTPTPVPARDTHSSHSNSSLSSLSQLSTPVHKDREGAASRSHSNSSNHTPSSANMSLTSTAAYTATSLANLVFSKPSTWGSSSGPTHTTTSHISPLPSRSSPPPTSCGLPLPPTLPPSHHSSPFSNHPGPPPPPLLPVGASHHGMFAPGSLTPTLPLDASTGPSPYRADSLFPQPNPDLLRRELDTRFLASQDHSIPIPPPPYMQTESHIQHGHIQHQAQFIGPPSLGAPLVTQPAPPHLYEKYPKLDSALYGRPSIGLPGYPPVSALFAPGGGASTPFAPPAHLTALQSKMNSVAKTKSLKPGKWCAMHVRIAWEIYNHQQKQKQAEAHKAGIVLAAAKPRTDSLHATNHLFPLSRQHDLSFSSSLLNSAASHPRAPFEASSHHSTFLNPTPAHLGWYQIGPFSRASYPGFAAPGHGFSSLGPLGIPASAVIGADLRSGCIPQDPWSQRTALSFAGNAPWGGLKEEAERDRMQHEQRKREEDRKRAEQEKREKEDRERREQDRREQERREMERREQERKEHERKEKERREQERREMERREMERRQQERREQEHREQEMQKERDRELRLHHHIQKNSAIVMNGEIRDHHHHHHHHSHLEDFFARERERVRNHQRSAVMNPAMKYETGLDRHLYNPRISEVKVKQERKDDEPQPPQQSSRNIRTSTSIPNIPEERSRKRPGSIPHVDIDDSVHVSRSVNHGAMAMSLASLDPTRTVGPHSLVQSPAKDPMSQGSPLWGPLTPSPTVSAVDHFRTREMHDRRFDPLSSVMSSRDRCTSSELSRQLSNAIDLERQFLDREHAAAAAVAYDRVKLLPPPLRANESPYMTPPTLPPASASSFFSPPVSPYLNSLCTGSSRSKAGPAQVINGLPPPLIPCSFPVQNHSGYSTNRTSSPIGHKLAASSSGVLNLHDPYFPKERREVNGHPQDLEPTHLRL